MGGNHQPEQVATLNRNDWQLSAGFSTKAIIRNEGFKKLDSIEISFNLYKDKNDISDDLEFKFIKSIEFNDDIGSLDIYNETLEDFPEFSKYDFNYVQEHGNPKIYCNGIIKVENQEIPFLIDIYFQDCDLGGGEIEPSYFYANKLEPKKIIIRFKKAVFIILELMILIDSKSYFLAISIHIIILYYDFLMTMKLFMNRRQ